MQDKIIISLFLLSFYFLTGCTTGSSTKQNAFGVSNKLFTIGCRFELERATNNDSQVTSFLHIGVPLWLDTSGQMQSNLSFSPLFMLSGQLYGLQISPIAGIERGKGVQCALIGCANSFDGLLLSPISLVRNGNCLQIGLLSFCGAWRGRGGTLGQVSVVNLAGLCPRLQLGFYNYGDMLQIDKGTKFYQVGIWNSSSISYVKYQNKEISDGMKSEKNSVRPSATKTQCGLVNKKDDYINSDLIEITGKQFGLVNLDYGIVGNNHNFQWGLINYADANNENLTQFGLINIKGHRIMLFFNR